MAAAIGLTASIIGVIQLTGQVAALGWGYIGSVKEAPKNMNDLLDELSSLSKVLKVVLDYTENTEQAAALEMLTKEGGPLQKCAEELRNLQAKLKPKSGVRGVINNLKWPLKEAETSHFISRIERYKSLFNFALNADHAALSKAIHEDVQEIGRLQVTKQQKDDLRHDEERCKRALDWLYSGDINTRHNEVKSIRQEGTGQWLPESSEFKEWTRQRQTCRLLWGRAIPGAGKTFLSSTAIDHFEHQAQAANYGVAHIYFDYKEQESQKPIQVLSSLVRQLANQVAPSLPIKIGELYDELEKKDKRPTMEQLYVALLEVSRPFAQVFFVFDALDECNPDTQRRELLPLFNRMGDNGIHVFLTSRPHPEDIQYSLCNALMIELSAHGDDITAYIREKIEGNSRAGALVRKAGCMDAIISGLIECAKGMFLLVRFHIEYLSQQTTARQILTALDWLKSSRNTDEALKSAYERAINSIHRQNQNSKDLAIKVLSWLVKARRTLTIEELRIAVSVTEKCYELDELNIPDPKTLVDVCASLVAIDHDEGTIRLSHYTVQEYLLAGSLIPSNTELNLATTCITYLSFSTLAQGACRPQEMKNRLKSHPFLNYVAHQLESHLKACDGNLPVDIYLNFIESQGSNSSWYQIFPIYEARLPAIARYSVFPDRELDYESTRKSGNVMSPLRMAVKHNHLTAIRLLLEKGANPTAKDPLGRTVLHHAASEGHEAVVGLLLDNGTEISHQDTEGITALHYAADKGHEATVRLLLSKGTDITLCDRLGYTALHYAASSGHEVVVKLLLDCGADMMSRDNEGSTALHKAAGRGHEVVVQLLLNCGADMMSRDNEGSTALHTAAYWGREVVAQLLLEKGADISSRDNERSTALHKAAYRGRGVVVQLLLDKGADMMSQNNEGSTALHKAANRGHEVVIQLLLQKGADISSRDNEGSTALHKAAYWGRGVVAQLLLDKGVDISSQDNEGSTALHKAAYRGHEVVVRLLLDKGADISSQDNKGSTALHGAAYRGRGVVVQLLLQKGADISSQDNKGSTALHDAASGGFKVVVVLLLDLGADISALDHNGNTVLHHAARAGQGEIVELLLERGADISGQDKYRDAALHAALHAAASQGHEAMIEKLLSWEVDISAQDSEGYTALHHAAEGGHEATVESLLNRGAEISLQDSEGHTALHLATLFGHETITRLLIDKGADITRPSNHGVTTLQLAAGRGNEVLVGLLLDKGANMSTQDNDGDTPLHEAALNGRWNTVGLLLDRGADFSILNKKEQTALDAALEDGRQDIVDLLLRRGFSFTQNPNSPPAALEEHSPPQVLEAPIKADPEIGNHDTQKQPDFPSITEPDIPPPCIRSPELPQIVSEIPRQQQQQVTEKEVKKEKKHGQLDGRMEGQSNTKLYLTAGKNYTKDIVVRSTLVGVLGLLIAFLCYFVHGLVHLG